MDISSVGAISEDSTLTVRIYVWGAAKDTGTFFFKEALTLTGTATETSGGGGGEEPPVQDTLAIDEIPPKSVSVGDTLSFPVAITVPAGMVTVTNVTATAGVEAPSFAIADGTFSYTPSPAHAALPHVEFTIAVSDASDPTASASETFEVAVSLPTSTLATWAIANASHTGDASISATPEAPISAGTLSRSGEVTAAGASGVFGASGFNSTASYEDAVDGGKYLEVSFTTAANFSIIPSALAYNIKRTDTGPTAAQWALVGDNGVLTTIGGEAAFSNTTTYAGLELDLSSLGEIGKGEKVTLRLYAWGASGSSGTFGFNTPSITLSGYDEKDETVYVAPSLDPIGDFWSYVGATNLVALSIANDAGTLVTTNPACATQGVQGEYSVANGYFRYVPAAADAALPSISFSVTLHVEAEGHEDVDATQSFSVNVYGHPDFVETFDSTAKTSWGDETPASVVEVAATWSGTNYMVQGQANDSLVSGRALRLRDTGYIEMETAKNGGAGAVALWSGFYNHGSGEAAVTVSVSHRVGKIWGDWEQIGTVQVGSDLAYSKIDGLEYEGYVRLRLDWTATQSFNIDDIAIFDYGEPVEEPVEDTTVIPLVYGKRIEQGFDAIGAGAAATLPSGWRVASAASQDFSDFDFAEASSQTTRQGGLNISATANAGIYNVGTGSLDRAVGFLSSGKNTRSAALMVHLRNDVRGPVKSFELGYSVGQWRRGHGRQVALHTSTDGQVWTPAGEQFVTATADVLDENGKASGYADGELPEPVAVSGKLTLPAAVPANGELYLGWFYTRVSGATDSGESGQLLAVDDIVIQCGRHTVIIVH